MRKEARDAAKDVICDIIAASGGSLRGKVRLCKAFYTAHLYYYAANEGVLTNYPIVRLPNGPGIDKIGDLLTELVDEGRIQVHKEPNGPYTEYVFELATPYTVRPDDPGYKAVEEAVQWTARKSAVELSEETHLLSRSWQTATDGEELDVYVDLLDDEEYDRIRQAVREREQRLSAAFAA